MTIPQFLARNNQVLYMTWSRWSSVTFVLLRDVQPPVDTFWYHQESVTIKSEWVTRILIKILGNRVEHAKKAVSLTFLMTWGKTKTWTTDSKNNSEESGFECEFLQVLKSIYFVCIFHIGTVICDKNLNKVKTTLSIKALCHSLISRIFSFSIVHKITMWHFRVDEIL